ncbi:MAG TPA: glycosyltransferase [Pirellulaceae bacterium]|nr:glycosyltransferase [Pirellulaceae bacterium]
MIRLLLVIPTLVRGGAEKQLSLLAGGLPRDEFDVHVAVLTHSGPLEAALHDAGIPVTLIGKRWKFDPLCYWRLRRHIRALGPDIVHTWLFAANAYGRQAAASVGIKHILAGERCVDPWKSAWQLAIDRALARQSERIVTNSSGVKDFYVSRGLPAEKFVIIPNGIAPSIVSEPVTREQLLAKLNLPTNARLLGAVGRLWPQKRVKDLIWAADLLKTTRDDTHLLIVGDGPQRWRLERYRDQSHITERVHFLGELDDVPRLVQHFDVLWLGSEYEGQSNAILEAMAAGVPVIATDIAGNRDLVVDGTTGYLVPLGDRFEFTRRTHWLLDDAALRQRMGEAGRQRVLTEFTVEKMVERHAELYRGLVRR